MPDKFWSLQRQIELYLKEPKMEGKSPKTVKSTRQTLMRGAKGLKEAKMELNPNKMNRSEMIFLRDHVYGGQLYNRLWNMSFWKGFMKHCDNHVFDHLDFKMTECTRRTVKWLSEEDDLRLWDFILHEADPLTRIVLTLESGLGLRRIELERLTMDDIQNGRIHVMGKGRNGGKPRMLSLDSVSTEAVETWMKHRDRLVSETLRLDPKARVPEKLLIHRHGKTLSGYGPTGFDKVVKNAAKRVSAKYGRTFNMSNHDLRRTMGRRMWKAGTKIETISKMLGHVNPIQTMKYLGIDQDDMKEAQDACMEKLMRKLEARKETASS